MRRRRTVVLGAVVAGVLLLGVGAWSVVLGNERSPEDTVEAFFEARQNGDCDELLDLVSEPDWSEDGRLGREEFLDICADVVGHYQPRLHEVQVTSQTGDRAGVRLKILADDDPQTANEMPRPRSEGVIVREYGDMDVAEDLVLAYEDGSLVREDGEWKVQLDQDALGLGRSVEQTVWGFLDAFRTGDCEALLSHLSRRAWSQDGKIDGSAFLDHCATEARARTTPPADEDLPLLSTTPSIAMPRTIEVSQGSDTATATVPWASGFEPETVRLVVEDLQWKVDTATLQAFEYAQLGAHLLGRSAKPVTFSFGAAVPIGPDDAPGAGAPLEIYEGDDAAGPRRKLGFRHGLAIVSGPVQHRRDLLLYEFSDEAGARTYAKRLFDRIVARTTEYNDVSPVSVRGIRGAKAIVTECSGPGFRPRSASGDCSRANKAAAVAVHGHYLVAVEAVDFQGPDATAAQMIEQAVQVLRAQLELL